MNMKQVFTGHSIAKYSLMDTFMSIHGDASDAIGRSRLGNPSQKMNDEF